jgi:hypothetical protein
MTSGEGKKALLALQIAELKELGLEDSIDVIETALGDVDVFIKHHGETFKYELSIEGATGFISGLIQGYIMGDMKHV